MCKELNDEEMFTWGLRKLPFLLKQRRDTAFVFKMVPEYIKLLLKYCYKGGLLC